MKRIFLILILTPFLIAFACKDNTKITIITPMGSPQLAILYLQDDSNSYDVTAVDGPSALQSAFGSRSHDCILAPTNLGAKLYNLNNNDYRLLAAVVWGNYYIVTKNANINSFVDLDNKDIILFGENSTGDYVCRYLFNNHEITPNISYVSSALLARNAFLEDTNRIVLLAEPQVSVLKNSVSELTILDIQELYEEATNSSSYPQASIFVKKDLKESKIKKIQADLENSIKKVIENVEESADLAVSLDLGFPKQVLISAIPLSNLVYKSGLDAKPAIEAYFNILTTFEANVVGGKLPDDEFYL